MQTVLFLASAKDKKQTQRRRSTLRDSKRSFGNSTPSSPRTSGTDNAVT